MIRAALALSIAAFSVSAAQAGETRSLTPEQAEAAIEAGARANAASAAQGLEPGNGDRRIHGEVGFGIGTGGYRSIYGTAVAPLGDDGVIALSFANEQYGNRRYRRR